MGVRQIFFRQGRGIRVGHTGGCLGDRRPVKAFRADRDGLPLTENDIQLYLDRRKPGQSRITTPRKDEISNVQLNTMLGDPIFLFYPKKRITHITFFM